MTLLRDSIDTLTKLIAFDSVSASSNATISAWVSERLASLGFAVEQSEYQDESGVRKCNIVARRDPTAGSTTGGLAYFCHTDVVPAAGWTGPGGDPFTAVLTEDRIYGRGSCDMKGSLVSMMAAASAVSPGEQTAPLWIVCTADEEVGFNGAKDMVAHSPAYRRLVEAQPVGIIGEPTSLQVVHAHKGITGFQIISRGVAAHSSTKEGVNANEAMVPMLQKLLELNQKTRQDARYQDPRFDPPILSWNFGISDQMSAINITPARSTAWCSLRPMPEIDGEDLIAEAKQQAESLGLEFKRFPGGAPVWIDPDAPCIRAMCELAGGQPRTVCYGTDGGEFTELNQIVVCGPGNIAQAHTTDEWIALEQIERGSQLLGQAIAKWCC
jgi:acetylornithine deacetylase